MRMGLPRSLSARITIGFMVLVATFGGISVWTVMTIDELKFGIRITHGGYLQLALVSGDLDSSQTALRSYLGEDLLEEKSPRNRLQVLLDRREKLLSQTAGILRDVAAIEGVKAEQFEATQQLVSKLERLIDESKPNYDSLRKRPPVAAGDTDAQSAEREAILKVQRSQLRKELQMGEITKNLKKYWTDQVLRFSERMEAFSRLIWLLALVFGALAVVLGIAMTVGARVMLRPLERLRDAAQSIAGGDYAQRITVQGPREIADLAREFNVMGQAIQERSRELVRTERLATAGKMAAMITHEVRNPLSSIGLNTELLEEELAALPPDRAPEAQSLCRAITTEVDRLTEITEEYLQLARMPTPRRQDESLVRVVQSVVDFVRDQLLTRGVRVELQLDDSGPSLALDEGQIRQAMLNLMRNAADACAEENDACISISVSHDDSFTELVIRDNGPGVDTDMLEHIFEAFVSSKQSGTGLGLALTHQIIRDHEGSIEVDNAPEGGAVFSIKFPHARSQATS